MDVKSYLVGRGIQIKRAEGNGELVLPCPQCGQDEACSINTQTGLWHCFRASCGAGGNLYTLQVAWGDAYAAVPAKPRPDYQANAEKVEHDWQKWVNALRTDARAQAARDYLAARCLTQTTIDAARLGWVPAPAQIQSGEPGALGLIAIPVFRQPDDVQPAMVKLRWVPPEPLGKSGKPERYRRLKGGESVLYTPQGQPKETAVICGGELDALSMMQALAEVGSDVRVVSPTQGEAVSLKDGSSSWSDEQVEQLDTCTDIVILLDADAAGRRAAEALALRLGRHRCRIGSWGKFKDANARLQAGELEGFDALSLMTAARSPAEQGVVRLSSLADGVVAQLWGGGSPAGETTGIAALDAIVGGLRKGEVIVVTGETGTGKTTFTTQLGLNRVGCGWRVMWLPFEMGASAQAELLAWQYLGGDPMKHGEERTREALNALSERCLVLDHYGEVAGEKLEATLRYACTRLGVDMFILDHLDYACGNGPDQWDQQNQLIKRVQRLVLECNVAALVVKHPDKGSGGAGWSKQSGDARVVQMHDLKGRSEVRQNFANVWSLWRSRDKERSSKVDSKGMSPAGLVVLKNRSRRGREDAVELSYCVAEARYYEVGAKP